MKEGTDFVGERGKVRTTTLRAGWTVPLPEMVQRPGWLVFMDFESNFKPPAGAADGSANGVTVCHNNQSRELDYFRTMLGATWTTQPTVEAVVQS